MSSASSTPSLDPTVATDLTLSAKPEAQGRAMFRRLLSEPTFVVGLVLVVITALMALFGPVIAPHDPASTNARAALTSPSIDFPMGTDQLGRDVLSRVLHGARASVLVALGAVGISAGVGVAIGVVTGYYRGFIDSILMRSIDVLLAFPGLILALVAAAVLGPGLVSVTIAVGVSGIPTFSRVTRSAVLSVCAEEYVLAAAAVGCSPVRIVRKHILPNILGPVMVMVTLYLAYAVLIAAALSFLGVGVQPPAAEWGSMVNDGRGILVIGWWVSVFPGLMIVMFVLGVNLIGDVLRDQFDAKLSQSEVG